MTLHNKAEHNTPDIVAALKRHKLTVDKPSVVSDAFRLGWAARPDLVLKPLEWVKDKDGKYRCDNGVFSAEAVKGDGHWLLLGRIVNRKFVSFADMDRFVHKDMEHRILSVLIQGDRPPLHEILTTLKEADTYLEEFGMITVGKSRRTLLKAIAMLEGHMNESPAD